MARAYFDSSALLSILFREERGGVAAALWLEHPKRVSSILLEAECLIGLKRIMIRSGVKFPKEWMDEKQLFLSGCLAEVNAKKVDETILEIMKKEEALAQCRALDAIHLATALHFRELGDGDFHLISFDERMRQTAKKLKLDFLPL